MRLDDVFAAHPADGVLGPADGGFVIAQWTDPGGSPEPIAPLHVHLEDDEAWYVLEGTLGFRVGDHESRRPPARRSSVRTAFRTRSGTRVPPRLATCS